MAEGLRRREKLGFNLSKNKMSEEKEKVVWEEEINALTKKSLQEAHDFSKIQTLKKKYLEKGGIISQFFQHKSGKRLTKEKKIRGIN